MKVYIYVYHKVYDRIFQKLVTIFIHSMNITSQFVQLRKRHLLLKLLTWEDSFLVKAIIIWMKNMRSGELANDCWSTTLHPSGSGTTLIGRYKAFQIQSNNSSQTCIQVLLLFIEDINLVNHSVIGDIWECVWVFSPCRSIGCVFNLDF